MVYVDNNDDNNIPAFYYRHYPQGTPEDINGANVDWLFPVTDTTGPLPDSIDFPLTVIDGASDQFEAHAFADPQARSALRSDGNADNHCLTYRL